jgi:hypothetical protein
VNIIARRKGRNMKTKLSNILVLLFALSLVGCAHNVEFRTPDTYQYGTALPYTAVFHMDQNIKNRVWSGRAASSGIIHRWDVPIGKTVNQYANSYLRTAFKEFNETETLETKQAYDILVKVEDINYYMANQAAHCDLTFTVEDSKGKQLFRNKYSEVGPSEFGRVIGGGVFAQKSAIRQSSHVALEKIFGNFVKDIQTNYKNW